MEPEKFYDKREALIIALDRANRHNRTHWVVVCGVRPVKYQIIINGHLDWQISHKVDPDPAPGARDRLLVRHGLADPIRSGFCLHEDKARAWLRDVVIAAEGQRDALARVTRGGETDIWPENIDSRWSPRVAEFPSAAVRGIEEICGDVYLLVRGAIACGAISCPPGAELNFDYDEDSYWAAVSLDPGDERHLLIRSFGEDNMHIGASDLQGFSAAMAVLGEMVAMGNAALSDLRHYIAVTGRRS